ALAMATLVASALVAVQRGNELPSFEQVRSSWCPSDVRVLDRHGVALHAVRVDASGRRLGWTPLDEVSSALSRAVIASEDRRFTSHAGVDWRAVAAAVRQRVLGGASRGASTITMQLVALVDPELHGRPGTRSVGEKLRQMRSAMRLEKNWTKDEILEAYLNLVTFRGEVQGVHAAADAIFGKQPHGLSTAESAVLAASLRAPNATRGVLRSRAVALLRSLDETASDLDEAVTRAGRLPDAQGPRSASALHVARQLVAKAPACRDVSSTLDARVQEIAAASLHRHLVELLDRSVRDGAVLVVDNPSGEVLAYVGSSGSLSSASQVDGVRALRQAGSTLKPFLYASAIERGLVTPATLLEDTALDVSLPGGSYRPANYDETFRGLVSVRTALAASLNIPAVRTLALVGDAEFARTLRLLGMSSVARPGDFYGPSLALGSADVSLWELVSAYRALAAGGDWTPLRLGVAGAGEHQRVFGADTAFLIGHILSDREGRATTFGLENALATPFWSAVKTGTSKDMRDNWCVGYTSRFTVGVWVGNFSGESMHDVSGVTGAAPVWQEVMSALHADEPGDAPPAPENVVEAWTSFAHDSEPARREFYRRGSEPVTASREIDSIPRIAAPVDGSILALDPDIASDRQRVALTVHAPRAGLAWRLDGRPLASAAETYLWEPRAGRHVLELVDSAGRRVDEARLHVKGIVTLPVASQGALGQ
ncbi:MAG: penicillin-binding protein 1C, partial [Candidatus Binatia bacterium]